MLTIHEEMDVVKGSEISYTNQTYCLDKIILSGDVERNPGPGPIKESSVSTTIPILHTDLSTDEDDSDTYIVDNSEDAS